VDPVTGEEQRVPLDRPLLGGGSTPSLASDGRRIALSATPDPNEYAGDRDVLLSDIARAPTRNITQTPDVSEGTPVFSPSGLWMLFTTSRYDEASGSITTELWRMRADGSERRRIGLGAR
jgi:Tol biopolymer transport system component